MTLTQHNHTQHNNTHHNGTQHSDTQLKDTQYNGTQHNGKNTTLSINDTQKRLMLCMTRQGNFLIVMLSVVMLNVILLNVAAPSCQHCQCQIFTSKHETDMFCLFSISNLILFLEEK